MYSSLNVANEGNFFAERMLQTDTGLYLNLKLPLCALFILSKLVDILACEKFAKPLSNIYFL